MKEFIKKLIERLEEEKKEAQRDGSFSFAMGFKVAISIVNQLAEEYKPKTQADKIRSMSDEELAEFFSERDKIPNRYKCKEIEDWVKWLQSEVE